MRPFAVITIATCCLSHATVYELCDCSCCIVMAHCWSNAARWMYHTLHLEMNALSPFSWPHLVILVSYLFLSWPFRLSFNVTEWWAAGVVICLERGADSGFHCHSLSLASVKSWFVLPLWYRLTWVVPEKGPFNGCVCVCVCYYYLQTFYFLFQFHVIV